MRRGLAALAGGGAAIVAALLAFVPAAARADDGLSRGRMAQAVGAEDAVTVLMQDGERVRLTGLQPPDDAALAEAGRALLDAAARDRRVRVRFDGERRDRRGRTLAQVFVEDGAEEAGPRWLAAPLLSAGLARVETTAKNHALSADMLALEAQARDAGRGLWAAPGNRVRGVDPAALAPLMDTFQIVEGVVADAAQTRDRVYLNFGPDYRTDFTVSMTLRQAQDVRDAGLEPLDLEGARIRVRGWLHMVNGPMIDMDHAAQIELLAPGAAARDAAK